jgi:hypothetical protein
MQASLFVGERVRRLRNELALTQGELASRSPPSRASRETKPSQDQKRAAVWPRPLVLNPANYSRRTSRLVVDIAGDVLQLLQLRVRLVLD